MTLVIRLFQAVFVNKKLEQDLNPEEAKPSVVNQ